MLVVEVIIGREGLDVRQVIEIQVGQWELDV